MSCAAYTCNITRTRILVHIDCVFYNNFVTFMPQVNSLTGEMEEMEPTPQVMLPSMPVHQHVHHHMYHYDPHQRPSQRMHHVHISFHPHLVYILLY